MKTTILKTTIALGIISILFTGCGVKHSTATGPVLCSKISEDCDGLLVAGVSSFSSYGFKFKIYNNSTVATIQAAADATLLRGKKYFAITRPSKIANTDGILINTAEEFIDECSYRILNYDPCGIHKTSGMRTGFIDINTYSKQQDDVITYSAEDVIRYLKKNDQYDVEAKLPKIRPYSR